METQLPRLRQGPVTWAADELGLRLKPDRGMVGGRAWSQLDPLVQGTTTGRRGKGPRAGVRGARSLEDLGEEPG